MRARPDSQDELRMDALASAGVEAVPVVRIQKRDVEKQIVYGVVYAPGEVDTHGETMFAPAIEDMCHNFMRLMATKAGEVIDLEHDNVVVSAYPVECYIEPEEGKDWPKGSWIMAVKIEDPVVWSMVKDGTLNGFSFEAMVSKMNAVVEVDVEVDGWGRTAEAQGHDHVFFVEYDEDGRIIGGTTSLDMGHRHTIRAGTTTDKSIGPGIPSHSHRLTVN